LLRLRRFNLFGGCASFGFHFKNLLSCVLTVGTKLIGLKPLHYLFLFLCRCSRAETFIAADILTAHI
jgi:hypothetical protein